MKLLIIRHGESTNNLLHATTGGFEGRSPDPLLTPRGQQQAQSLAQAMIDGAQPAPTVIYCSLMSRAIQTAAPLADALDLPIVGHPEIYEAGGPYEGDPTDPVPHPGASRSELQALTPRIVLPTEAEESGWYHGHGEDDPARAERGAMVIRQMVAAHAGQDYIVGLVCHEWIAQYLIRAAIGFHAVGGVAEPWMGLNNTGTTFIDMEQPVPVTETSHNGASLERVLTWHNNTRHLPLDLITG